jgi:stage II sporulation SpoM-like protein
VKVKFNLPFWTKASTGRKRIYTFIAIFLIGFLLTLVGSLIPISHKDAQQLSNSLNSTVNQNKASGTLPQYIFENNFGIDLRMFIPVLGPIMGLAILANTGYALGAIAQVQGVSPFLEVFALILTPVFWLEFTSYSIAISESIWLLRRLLQQRWGELKVTAILIGVCAVLLAVGAIVETWLISIGV